MTDLRRLAEQALAAGKGQPWRDYRAATMPQAILALLDQNEYTWHAYQRCNESRNLAERRVAALEEGLQRLYDRYTMRPPDYRAKYGIPAGTRLEDGVNEEDEDRERVFAKARALLAAAPSEPPDCIGTHAWDVTCPSCDDGGFRRHWTDKGWHRYSGEHDCWSAGCDVPAAQPSASAEAEGLPAEVGE